MPGLPVPGSCCLSSLSPPPPHCTVSAPAKQGRSLPQTHPYSVFLEFFPGLMLSLLPLFCLYISPSFFHMSLSRKPLQLTKMVPFKSQFCRPEMSGCYEKDNVMRYISRSIRKVFGKSILFYAKCFRLTFKYVKVSAK